jgi:hypothetical protein
MMSLAASKNICSCSPKQAARLSRAVASSIYQAHVVGLGYPATTRAAAIARQPWAPQQPSFSHGTRHFSTTNANQLRDVFPAKDTPFIRTTPPAWSHPGYTEEEMLAVVPGHRQPETLGDWIAWKLVRIARYVLLAWTWRKSPSITTDNKRRWATDFATGIGREQQVDMKNPTTSVVAQKPLSEAQWVCLLFHYC